MCSTILMINDHSHQIQPQKCGIIEKLGYHLKVTTHIDEAIDCVEKTQSSALACVIINRYGALHGLSESIKKLHGLKPYLPVIIFTDAEDSETSKKELNGAFDVMMRPVSLSTLARTLGHAMQMARLHRYISWLERSMAGHLNLSDLVGVSESARSMCDWASEAAANDIPLYIFGESGVGKEYLARCIHGESARSGQPFVVVNSEMLPTHSTENMLFGSDKPPTSGQHFSLGKWREAEGGTLLIKSAEILPDSVKQKLLRSAQTMPKSGMVKPARLIFSQQENLKHVDYPSVYIPPLCQRVEDILPIAEHFLALYTASEKKYVRDLSENAKKWIQHHPWPGNVAQLAYIIKRAILLCEGDSLELADLYATTSVRLVESNATTQSKLTDEFGGIKSLRKVQEEAIRYALTHSGGSMTKAARKLGIGRSTLYRKVSELNIKTDGYISRANQTTRPMIDTSSMPRS